jgi:hypothetical protein
MLRIIGVAFILFMLYILFFPGTPEQEGDTETHSTESPGRARLNGGTDSSTTLPKRQSDDDFGSVLTLPEHRKAHL